MLAKVSRSQDNDIVPVRELLIVSVASPIGLCSIYNQSTSEKKRC
jgi:hypothetical protein